MLFSRPLLSPLVRRTRTLAFALAIGAIAVAVQVQAQAQAQAQTIAEFVANPGNLDQVLARVDGGEVKRRDVASMLTNLPPQMMEMSISVVYPLLIERLVDNKLVASAARQARDRLWARRRQPGLRKQSDAIVERHGSCRSGLGTSGGGGRRTQKAGAGTPASQGVIQLGLDL